MTHGVYVVTGNNYRGHAHGVRFTARLDRNAEKRAIYRRDIALVERVIPSITKGAVTFPDGWLDPPPKSVPQADNRGRGSGLSR